MRSNITFGSSDEAPNIEIQVIKEKRTFLTLWIGDLEIDFFNNPEKVLGDLRHAIRVAEDTLFSQEQAEVRS